MGAELIVALNTGAGGMLLVGSVATLGLLASAGVPRGALAAHVFSSPRPARLWHILKHFSPTAADPALIPTNWMTSVL